MGGWVFEGGSGGGGGLQSKASRYWVHTWPPPGVMGVVSTCTGERCQSYLSKVSTPYYPTHLSLILSPTLYDYRHVLRREIYFHTYALSWQNWSYFCKHIRYDINSTDIICTIFVIVHLLVLWT